jgi:hypothetical protein
MRGSRHGIFRDTLCWREVAADEIVGFRPLARSRSLRAVHAGERRHIGSKLTQDLRALEQSHVVERIDENLNWHDAQYFCLRLSSKAEASKLLRRRQTGLRRGTVPRGGATAGACRGVGRLPGTGPLMRLTPFSYYPKVALLALHSVLCIPAEVVMRVVQCASGFVIVQLLRDIGTLGAVMGFALLAIAPTTSEIRFASSRAKVKYERLWLLRLWSFSTRKSRSRRECRGLNLVRSRCGKRRRFLVLAYAAKLIEARLLA